ncbi:T9SS type A sorting domain-containing protein [bacterium]|nr:MAG: T9SS type A sorting domain-containing protein [bacterium]
MSSNAKPFLVIFILLVFGLLNAQILERPKCGFPPEHEDSARNWGYGYSDLLEDIELWQQSPFVSIDSIGSTVQGRAVWELIISENPSSDFYKRIYIHARTHPGEEESFWVADEIINYLIADTQEAAFIRSNTIFHIVPMHNPDGVELGYARENANGLDIESGWDDSILQPEVVALQNRFIELSFAPNPIKVALNMHSAYACKRYFVYHHENGTSDYFTDLEKQFISGVQFYYPDGFEDWNYYISWTNSTPDQYPESWWWFNYAEDVLALTYEDMNCSSAGNFDRTAEALIRGSLDFVGINIAKVENDVVVPDKFILNHNYPNPFNPSTSIDIELKKSSHVRLSISDLNGKEVRVITDQFLSQGINSFHWDSKDSRGRNVPAGVYFYQAKSNSIIQSKKMVLLK